MRKKKKKDKLVTLSMRINPAVLTRITRQWRKLGFRSRGAYAARLIEVADETLVVKPLECDDG